MVTLIMPDMPCWICGQPINRFATIPDNLSFILTRNKCHHCNNVMEIPLWRVK